MIRSAESTDPDSALGTCMIVPFKARFDAQYLHGFEDIAGFVEKMRTNHPDLSIGTMQMMVEQQFYIIHVLGLLNRFMGSSDFRPPPYLESLLGWGPYRRGVPRNLKGVWEGYTENQRNSSMT